VERGFNVLDDPACLDVAGTFFPARAGAGAAGAAKRAPRALPASSLPSPAEAADLIRSATPVGSALKSDAFHRAAVFGVDDVVANGSVYRHIGGDGVERTLIQVPAEVNGITGRFEYVVDDALNLTHQEFIKGGTINGLVQIP